jgi:hypothetical protein
MARSSSGDSAWVSLALSLLQPERTLAHTLIMVCVAAVVLLNMYMFSVSGLVTIRRDKRKLL